MGAVKRTLANIAAVIDQQACNAYSAEMRKADRYTRQAREAGDREQAWLERVWGECHAQTVSLRVEARWAGIYLASVTGGDADAFEDLYWDLQEEDPRSVFDALVELLADW